ncbi:uncharacterized protein ATNIH1004_005353 [Aspergillus tanneri]|uniref:Protein kinase domain-containing protein n=1 Tax=Aspergillus tanneri TaxID=1220188 RepID=A0A5M9MI87_9EURO|nr:uncharacterized protein ATNIH1004_005353 [Aspergillus tanneri]KAA8646678.1 hypothetical protein ATNIH1004_005353 [Aspergillus tanneri]
MSLQEIQEQEEQRLREQAERSQIEEQRHREEEQQRREEEQRLREQAERSQIEEQRLREQAEEQLKLQTQETTLPEFLDACHVHLFLGLSIQKDKDSSTKATRQTPTTSIWEDLMNTEFVTKRHFTPLLALKEFGKEARERMQERYTAEESRPRADQICVYNKGPEGKVPVFIIEYKAPHKVSLAHIKSGLQDMDLDEVLRLQKEESPEDICRRVVAAVITQTFSYMIHGGLEYGYACTGGEAFIFLRVLYDNPSTVYYYLSVPEEDVGQTTGWTGDPSGANRLHLTALVRRLKTWEMVYDDLLDEIAEKDIPSSDFKPSTQSRNEYCLLRKKSRLFSHDDDAGDGFDPNTPSRRPQKPRLPQPSASSSLTAVEKSQGSRSKGKSRQYCTQQCLLGLIKGWELDQKCPNVLDHGINRHRLNQTTLIHRLDRQLSRDNLQLDSQLGCESLHVHGTCGALFKIILWSHGYTFVGKGAPVEFLGGSKHEELMYSHLSPIQGVSVPVLLGSLRLRRPFYYDGIAEMVHLMFMGYAGRTLASRHDLDHGRLIQQAEKSLQAIHDLRVLQGDPIPSNMVEENGRVMFIDFERATLQTRRIPLGGISPNQKRKRGFCSWEKSPNKRLDCFEREKRRMRHGL